MKYIVTNTSDSIAWFQHRDAGNTQDLEQAYVTANGNVDAAACRKRAKLRVPATAKLSGQAGGFFVFIDHEHSTRDHFAFVAKTGYPTQVLNDARQFKMGADISKYGDAKYEKAYWITVRRNAELTIQTERLPNED